MTLNCDGCSNDSSFEGDQKSSGEDLGTCELNAMLSNISQQLSDKINIPGASVDINELANCAAKNIKVSGGTPTTPSRQVLEYLRKFASNVKIPIKCKSGKQNNNNDACSDTICYINVKLKLVYVTVTVNSERVINKFLQDLCKGSTVIGISQSSYLIDQLDNITSDPEDIPIIDIPNDKIIYDPTQPGHAVTCLGYSCDGDKICFTIRDSYTWGNNSENKVREFKICRNKTAFMSNPIATFVPGLAGPKPNQRLLRIDVDKIIEDTDKCCKDCVSDLDCPDGQCCNAEGKCEPCYELGASGIGDISNFIP